MSTHYKGNQYSNRVITFPILVLYKERFLLSIHKLASMAPNQFKHNQANKCGDNAQCM